MTAGAGPRPAAGAAGVGVGDAVAKQRALPSPRGPGEEDPADGLGGVDLRLLRYFLAVAEELHFGAAARRLRIAQPALSNAIKVLETRLGVTLLRRTTRRVELTQAGQVLLDGARVLLDAHTALLGQMAAQRRAEARTVCLGYSGSFTGLLPAAAGRARAGSQALEIELRDLGAGAGFAALLARDVDAALLTSPLSEGQTVESVLLGHSSRMLAVSRGHRLARGSHTDPVEGWSGRHVSLRASAPGWAEFWSPSGFFRRPPSERVWTLEQALELVAAGRGATMVPAISIDRCSRADIAFLPIRGQPRVGVYLAWRREDGSSPLKELVPVLRAAMQDGAEVEVFDDLDWLTVGSEEPL